MLRPVEGFVAGPDRLALQRPSAALGRTSGRVLHVSRVGFVGGAEQVMLTLAVGLPALGYEPAIAAPAGGTLDRQAREAGVPLHPMPFDRLRITRDPRVLARYPLAWFRGGECLLRACVANGTDVLHAHHPVGALYAGRAVRVLGLPLILHLHDGPPMSAAYRILLRQASRTAERIVCVSRAVHTLLADAGGDVSKAEIVANAVDERFFEPRTEPALDVVGPGPHIGLFGVIEPRKGQDHLLRAVALLTNSYPTAHVWIVGPLEHIDKAPFKRAVESLAATPALRGRVTFTGRRDDVPALMRAMDVVVSASVSHESFGMVLAEAMALGRPVVTSDVGGTAEVVTDGKTGRVVPPADPAALASAIAQTLERDRSAMAAAAAADARARFSPAIFWQRIADIYDQVLQK